MNFNNIIKKNKLITVIVIFSIIFLIFTFFSGNILWNIPRNKDGFGEIFDPYPITPSITAYSNTGKTYYCFYVADFPVIPPISPAIGLINILNAGGYRLGDGTSPPGEERFDHLSLKGTKILLITGYVKEIKFSNDFVGSDSELKISTTNRDFLLGKTPRYAIIERGGTKYIYTYINFNQVYDIMIKVRSSTNPDWWSVKLNIIDYDIPRYNWIIDYTGIYSDTGLVATNGNTPNLINYIGTNKNLKDDNFLEYNSWGDEVLTYPVFTTNPKITSGFSGNSYINRKPGLGNALAGDLGIINSNTSIYGTPKAYIIPNGFVGTATNPIYIRSNYVNTIISSPTPLSPYTPNFIGIQSVPYDKDQTLKMIAYNEIIKTPDAVPLVIMYINNGTLNLPASIATSTPLATANAEIINAEFKEYTSNQSISKQASAMYTSVLGGTTGTPNLSVNVSQLTLASNWIKSTSNIYLVTQNSYFNNTGIDIKYKQYSSLEVANAITIPTQDATLSKSNVWYGKSNEVVLLTDKLLITGLGGSKAVSKIVPSYSL